MVMLYVCDDGLHTSCCMTVLVLHYDHEMNVSLKNETVIIVMLSTEGGVALLTRNRSTCHAVVLRKRVTGTAKCVWYPL